MSRSNVSVSYVILFILFLYVVHLFAYLGWFEIKAFGIEPRSFNGLIGIVFSPVIHVNLAHLVSNTVPLLVLMGVTFIFYPRNAFNTVVLIWMLGGLLLWLLGRDAIHVGASGLIYGLASFLIAIGFIKKSIKTLLIAVFVILTYGSMVYGLLPSRSYVSWEGHLLGALAGVYAAYKLK